MKFVKYNSVENSYQEKFMDRIIREGRTDGDWIVTEKIHGANFSFWYDGKKFRMAKRTGWIADDENFYGIKGSKHYLTECVKELYSRFKNIDYIAVFGEIYGGTYPHPDVLAFPNAKKVQKGVYYCPHNDFMVYDIKVDGKFINFIDMQMYCECVGLRFVRAKFVGTFKECLEHKNDFLSGIYKEYDLPSIEDNICEGIVIRPNKAQFVFTHSRVMLKSKNDRFKEKASERKPRIKIELTGISKDIADGMFSMVTKNRYDAVISKIGEVKISDFGKLQGLMMKDIHEEVLKDTDMANDFLSLEKAQRKLIQKIVGSEVANLIREELIRK
jgi:Rnl2 family RNA ligase